MQTSIHDETGLPMSHFFTGPVADWQTYQNAVTSLPKLQHERGVPDDLHLIVMVHKSLEAGRGLFRDCRWDYDELYFVDRVTGETYDAKQVFGWTVGLLPF